MKDWIKWLTILPQLISFVKSVGEVAKHIEDVVAPDTRGPAKKAAVQDVIEAAAKLSGEVGGPAIPIGGTRNVTGFAIDAIVSVYNTLGLFKHKGESK